jgi:hypothetical protein
VKIANHKINGVRLDFENDISVSTIWGIGSYSENHDIDDNWKSPISESYDRHDFDSSDCEMYFLKIPEKLNKKIYKKYADYSVNGEGQHLGHLPIEKWLEIIEICRKYHD